MYRRFQVTFCLVLATMTGASMMTASSWSEEASDKANASAGMTREDAKKLKSPVPFNKASIARGKVLYTRDCTECHGADGKSLVDVVANATDLTEPKLWRSGTTEGEVFRSIRDGAGDAMPPFADKVEKEEDLWNMVNFLRSLWPESDRPKLEADKPR